jgi:phosphoglycerate dehydrogenase-like enzyme
MSTSSSRYRLHLESRRAQGPAFHLTEDNWSKAAARHPDMAAQLDVSFGWDGEQLDAALGEADFLLASKFPTAAANAAGKLRWIHTTGAGVDQLTQLNTLHDDIALTNSSGIHSDKAREFTQMALLMLHMRMPQLSANQRAHQWSPLLTPSINGKTAVVIGFGDIGQAAGHAAHALGLRVIAVSRSGRVDAGAPADSIVSIDRLEDVLPQADFVVLAAPLTAHTRNLLNAQRQACMRPGACIVNLSRAGLLDHVELVARLRSGACAGAVLDVFDPEPLPPDAPLWDVPGLVITPHVSCDVPDYNQRVLDMWFGNFQCLLRNAPMRNLVDRQLGY